MSYTTTSWEKRFHQPIYCDFGDDLLVALPHEKKKTGKSVNPLVRKITFRSTGGSEVQQPMSKKDAEKCASHVQSL